MPPGTTGTEETTVAPSGLPGCQGAVRSVAAHPGAPAAADAALEPAELRAWNAFLRARAAILRQLEAELAAGTGLPLAHYEVLMQLGCAEHHRLRMHTLAERLLLSRSGVTRLVDRLEREGLARRMTCPSDARGSFAVLTDAGLERLRDATPVYLQGVRRHFVDPLGPEDLEVLAAILERLAASSEGRASPTDRSAEPPLAADAVAAPGSAGTAD
ncbi:MAG: MarR family winged helix-turn-helix transcriptional regulator [Candidatus Limnocylindrales bacterium]